MRIFNTLSGQKEEFVPAGPTIKMYVCGVTPYDSCHIGHAMSYIIFDVVRRYLEHKGFNIKHVQNFTDVDDKIINRANAQNCSAEELASRFIEEYFKDMDSLNIKRAHEYPRATEMIEDIIKLVEGLIDKGHAYTINGDVYFRVQSADGYGKLSRRNLDDMRAGARIKVDKSKENPLDFALWKLAKPGEPSWESPWGMGRPGWHIECSAMSLKYLGNQLDIHGGGHDLVFPHHENEIAQSEAFTGKVPFAKYWMHNGLLRLDQDKMSKSLGNLITVRQILDTNSADALRLFVLSSHYRSPLTYSDETLAAAESGLKRLIQAANPRIDALTPKSRQTAKTSKADDEEMPSPDTFRQRFETSMDDDFNTSLAIATLFDLASVINRAANLGNLEEVHEHRQIFSEIADVLGLRLEKVNEKLEAKLDPAPFHKLAVDLSLEVEPNQPASVYIDELIKKRTDSRKAKHWAMADKIRNSLEKLDIILEDLAESTQWKPRR